MLCPCILYSRDTLALHSPVVPRFTLVDWVKFPWLFPCPSDQEWDLESLHPCILCFWALVQGLVPAHPLNPPSHVPSCPYTQRVTRWDFRHLIFYIFFTVMCNLLWRTDSFRGWQLIQNCDVQAACEKFRSILFWENLMYISIFQYTYGRSWICRHSGIAILLESYENQNNP